MLTNDRVALSEAQGKVERREPFTSGQMRGSRGPDGGYTVWSYHEPIAGTTRDGVSWWINSTRFSMTTGKHQNVVRRALEALGVEPIEVRR